MPYRSTLLTCLIACAGNLPAQPPGLPNVTPPPLPFSKSSDAETSESPADLIQTVLSQDGALPSPKALLEAIGRQLDSENPLDRINALMAVEQQGELETELKASLHEILRDGESPLEKILAAKSLVGTSDSSSNKLAFQTLASGLHSADPAVASQSMVGLRAMGKQSESAFMASLDAPQASTKALAAESLGEIQSSAATPKLVALLVDANGRVRVAAAKSLGSTGRQEAIAPLVASLRNDPDLAVKANSAASLLELAPNDADVHRALVAAIVKSDERTGLAIIRAIANCKADPKTRADTLAIALPQAKPAFASELISHLVEMEDAGMQALIRSLDEENARYWAAVALGDFGTNAASAGKNLAMVLGESTPDVQTEILLTLAKIKSTDSTVADAIVEQLDSKESGVRYAATLATVRLNLDGEEVTGKLQANCASDDKVLALVSSFALAKRNPSDLQLAKRTLDALAEAVRSGDKRLKPLALEAIKELREDSLRSFPLPSLP